MTIKRIFSRNRWISSTLNIIGLTVAFTAFMVIMIQVRYDWRYDRNYPEHEKVFRLEFVNDPSNLGSYGITICRPFIVSVETQFHRKEIALRKVHGAAIGTILMMLNRQYIIMTLICFAISVPVAYFIMKAWVKGFAYQAPVPVWLFIASLCAVLAVTMLTVTLLTYRAATQNPVNSLHDE